MPAANVTALPAAAAAAPLDRLARLVVKSGVALGLLPEPDRQLALASVWAGLPAGEVLNEPGVNQQLKTQLAGPAAWLRTDHVELRRWLVDAGWLLRDGYGREYRRAAAPFAREPHDGLAAALEGLDVAAWAAAQRGAHQAVREQRRQRWAPGSPPAGAAGARAGA